MRRIDVFTPALLLHRLAPDSVAAVRAAVPSVCPGTLVCQDPSAVEGADFAVLHIFPAGQPAPEAGGADFVCPLPPGASPEALAALLQAGWQGLQLARENASLRGNLRSIGRRMAHDLRTPLGSALTLSQLLQEITPASQTDVQGFLGSIVRSTERLRELIDKMAFFAKSALDPLELTPVALGEVVQTVQARVGLLQQRKQATLSGPANWPTVLGDAPALETIWRQLLTNALEHGGEKPAVELAWQTEEGGWIRCFVRDRGSGPSGQQAHPFETLHALTNTRGLGLSVVERLVAQHGGSCCVTERPGGGTEVSFTLRAG